jgi:hypothetical protein
MNKNEILSTETLRHGESLNWLLIFLSQCLRDSVVKSFWFCLRVFRIRRFEELRYLNEDCSFTDIMSPDTVI